MQTLQVESLTKRYGSVTGAEDVSFAVERGEIFGYLGPNGSGKTTTIRCIMGLLKPTSGRCRVFGCDVMPGYATRHEKIGYLPGDFRIWPRCSAESALAMLARLGGVDGARKRREALAERLELDLGRRVGDLSKGNRQKVGVVYAFQHQPDLLILDEPTIGLDPLVRQTVLDLIRRAARDGATVLLSSHDLAEVSAVCSRAAILRKGRLVELAAISEIVRQGERHIKIWFADPSAIPAPPLDSLGEVRVVNVEPGIIHLAYKGSPDAVLKWAAQSRVDRIATPETSLEEAFIQYYVGDPAAEGGAT
ncbi:MAG: ABC transporter ATP-binding protein [Sedimentisphaerales bacterium]|nr:ABC transporter ATP-binding protein [Sedimentisphaerales bacterium]